MANNVLNPWALDSDGKIINIENACKGEAYTCPVCKERLSYCKKGTGPNARKDHFMHTGNSNCSGGGESEIHNFAKEQVYDILRNCIDNSRDLTISWTCPNCQMDFTASLLKRAKDVRMEHNLDIARPDVALLDEKGIPIIAIEIVVTHDVEEQTLRFYDANNIVLIRIIINSAEDCNDMMNKLQHPDSCNLCFYENCERSKTMQPYRTIFEITKEGRLIGLAVEQFGPFDEYPKRGLPFTKIDMIKAINIANQHWSGYEYIQDKELYLLVQKKKTIIQRSTVYHQPRPTIEQIAAKKERQIKAIRKNYAIKASSSKGRKKRR